MKLKVLQQYELDYLILASIVNSEETEEDILKMVTRFVALRFQSDILDNHLSIQNPPSETKKEDL